MQEVEQCKELLPRNLCYSSMDFDLEEVIMLAKKIIKSYFAILLMVVLSIASAESYAPYRDKLSAKVVSIKSASVIDVSAETWPGFSRTFSISLAGIETPKNASDAALCQQKLAEKALDFVKDYLQNATKIEIHNMTMKTSADQDAEADIFTEKGSLSKALKGSGFARSADIDGQEPWC